MSSADDLFKQFGPRYGPTEYRSQSGSKPFDTDSVPERFFFEKANFEKSQRMTTKAWKLPSMIRGIILLFATLNISEHDYYWVKAEYFQNHELEKLTPKTCSMPIEYGIDNFSS